MKARDFGVLAVIAGQHWLPRQDDGTKPKWAASLWLGRPGLRPPHMKYERKPFRIVTKADLHPLSTVYSAGAVPSA